DRGISPSSPNARKDIIFPMRSYRCATVDISTKMNTRSRESKQPACRYFSTAHPERKSGDLAEVQRCRCATIRGDRPFSCCACEEVCLDSSRHERPVFAMRLSRNLNLNVHGARGLFAFAVFIYHVINSGLPTYPALDGSWIETYLFYSLKFGVELFFGISGVVIVGALVRAPSIRAFAWDRVTRIYPVLWVSLLSISAMAVIFNLWRPAFGDWLLNFIAPPPFLHVPQVNPAAWSLGYEITFYALCAAAWWL